MDAVLIVRDREPEGPDGLIVETVIWRVPSPVPGSEHPYKYRLFFGRNGERIIGYDNERGKGDHKHLDGQELPYDFTNITALLRDFREDIAQWMSKNGY